MDTDLRCKIFELRIYHRQKKCIYEKDMTLIRSKFHEVVEELNQNLLSSMRIISPTNNVNNLSYQEHFRRKKSSPQSASDMYDPWNGSQYLITLLTSLKKKLYIKFYFTALKKYCFISRSCCLIVDLCRLANNHLLKYDCFHKLIKYWKEAIDLNAKSCKYHSQRQLFKSTKLWNQHLRLNKVMCNAISFGCHFYKRHMLLSGFYAILQSTACSRLSTDHRTSKYLYSPKITAIRSVMEWRIAHKTSRERQKNTYDMMISAIRRRMKWALALLRSHANISLGLKMKYTTVSIKCKRRYKLRVLCTWMRSMQMNRIYNKTKDRTEYDKNKTDYTLSTHSSTDDGSDSNVYNPFDYEMVEVKDAMDNSMDCQQNISSNVSSLDTNTAEKLEHVVSMTAKNFNVTDIVNTSPDVLRDRDNISRSDAVSICMSRLDHQAKINMPIKSLGHFSLHQESNCNISFDSPDLKHKNCVDENISNESVHIDNCNQSGELKAFNRDSDAEMFMLGEISRSKNMVYSEDIVSSNNPDTHFLPTKEEDKVQHSMSDAKIIVGTDDDSRQISVDRLGQELETVPRISKNDPGVASFPISDNANQTMIEVIADTCDVDELDIKNNLNSSNEIQAMRCSKISSFDIERTFADRYSTTRNTVHMSVADDKENDLFSDADDDAIRSSILSEDTYYAPALSCSDWCDTVLRKMQVRNKSRQLVKCFYMWKYQIKRKLLLSGIFSRSQRLWNERWERKTSDYFLLKCILGAWNQMLLTKKQLKNEKSNDLKSLVFRGFTLQARMFFNWRTNVHITKKNKLKLMKINHLLKEVAFVGLLKNVKNRYSQMNRAIFHFRQSILRTYFIVGWRKQFLGKYSSIAIQKRLEKHKLNIVFKLWCLQYRSNLVKAEFDRKYLKQYFKNWRVQFKRFRKVKKGLSILINVLVVYRAKRMFYKWIKAMSYVKRLKQACDKLGFGSSTPRCHAARDIKECEDANKGGTKRSIAHAATRSVQGGLTQDGKGSKHTRVQAASSISRVGQASPVSTAATKRSSISARIIHSSVAPAHSITSRYAVVNSHNDSNKKASPVIRIHRSIDSYNDFNGANSNASTTMVDLNGNMPSKVMLANLQTRNWLGEVLSLWKAIAHKSRLLQKKKTYLKMCTEMKIKSRCFYFWFEKCPETIHRTTLWITSSLNVNQSTKECALRKVNVLGYL